MPKRSSERLRKQLEKIFSSLMESKPRTGPLTASGARLLGSQTPQGWLWETDTNGRYVWCSPEVRLLLGYSIDELMGQDISSVGFTPQSAQQFKQAMVSGQLIQNMKLTAIAKDGRKLTLLINALARANPPGKSKGYRGVAQVLEITEVRPERFAVPLPQPAEKISVDTAPEFAPTWGTVLGYTDDGKAIRPLATRGAAVVTQPRIEEGRLIVPIQAQDTYLGVVTFEEKEDGGAWTDEDQEMVESVTQQLAMALQDARSYQLTQHALEEMREADRLKSQFLANMSHELRTPLNSIIGFSKVILKGIDGPINYTQEQDLNAIYNAGQHLLGLINDILDLSKIEAGKMELAFTEVDLDEIIRGVMSTAAGLVKDKPIELETHLPDQMPIIEADNIRIRQVLLNLVSNAAKFTERGKIGLSSRIVDHGDRQEVLIAVYDTGPGIEPENQAKLFEPFSQVDASPTRKTGGTGLGLSICRHLVELHGGRIWVESTPGEGSTFAFTLPIEHADPTHPSSEGPLVLLISDDETIADWYREALGGRGYRLHSLSQLEESVELAGALIPSAILLDLLLPSLDAWKLLMKLKSSPKTRPIPTALSALMKESNQGSLLPVASFIKKPIQEQELLTIIRRLFPDPKKPLDLMIIDHNLEDLRQLRTTLETKQLFRVHTAGAAHVAIEVLQLEPPDLILLNLTMPNGNAFQVLQTLGKNPNTTGIPVIAILPTELQAEGLDQLRKAAGLWIQKNLLPADVLIANLEQRLSMVIPSS